MHLYIGLGDDHLRCVGIAHQHANHLRLHPIDGHPLLPGLHEVSGEHGLMINNKTYTEIRIVLF